MKKALLEALKEAGRIALFAAVAALVAWGQAKLANADPESTLVIVGTLVLRLADKFVHENESTSKNGLAPF